MIQKYRFGNPIPTEAVVTEICPSSERIRQFHVEQENQKIKLSCFIGEHDHIYGLGENVRGINKKGFIYKSFCSDDPNHEESKSSLYAAHNFFIVDSAERFGVFIDFPGLVTFDMAFTDYTKILIETDGSDADIYVIEADSLTDIVKEFRALIGRSYIPPKWALGYQQCRWGYASEEDFRNVFTNYVENDLPLDSIGMDIDYMERFKDFTIDRTRFPHFEELVDDLKKENVRIVPIIDGGVKVEEGYDVYEEGVKNGYFCKREDGTNFVAGVWPGNTHFPDFLNKDARKWFGDKYKFLTDKGIDGFWNDMNEPAIFYSEEGIKEALNYVSELAKGDCNMDTNEFFKFQDVVNGVKNSMNDYRRFYHDINGTRVRHDKVHNLFGYYMTRAAAESLDEICPDKRMLLFSRASYIGMHRYGGIWTGDNKSEWSHLLLNIQMMPSLNMCGFLYTGADMGGFGCNTSRDLLLRWLAFDIFSPLMRNHSALGTRDQEIYRFERLDDFRSLLKLRYRLIPYIYSELVKAALNNDMLFKPLSFVYTDDKFAENVDDQLMVGESIMIAPVYKQNAIGRYVYIPEDMLMIRFKAENDYTTSVVNKGIMFVDVDLSEVVFFIRKNHLLVLGDAANNTASMSNDHYTVIGYVTDSCTYSLYNDDGMTKKYDLNNSTIFKVTDEPSESVLPAVSTTFEITRG